MSKAQTIEPLNKRVV